MTITKTIKGYKVYFYTNDDIIWGWAFKEKNNWYSNAVRGDQVLAEKNLSRSLDYLKNVL